MYPKYFVRFQILNQLFFNLEWIIHNINFQCLVHNQEINLLTFLSHILHCLYSLRLLI